MFRKFSILCAAACFPSLAMAAETIIWVEGEQAVKRQLVDNPGLNDVNPDELSGGKWICSFSHEHEPTGAAEYTVEIPDTDDYHLWVRAAGGTGLSYRLDDAKEAVDVDIRKGQDAIPIAADGNPFYPPQAAWFDLGTLKLTQGKHKVTWYLGGLKAKDRWGGLDCFVLTTGAFVARGKYRPGEQTPEPIVAFRAGQAWDFQPELDAFDLAALLDLRGLNEKAAGEHGFIRLNKDGNSFVCGDGRPIRFWAAGERTAPNQSLEVLNRQSQFLAKHGVNALRIFAMIPPKAANSQFTDVDEKELDAIFKVVAAMKSAGNRRCGWKTSRSYSPLPTRG
jgi:hypothetical protein